MTAELIERLERGENTFALEQDIGNHFSHLYPNRPTVWPAYCNSLDAAIALVERVRPRDASNLVRQAWGDVAKKHALHIRFWSEEDGSYAKAFAAALIAALLKAEAK